MNDPIPMVLRSFEGVDPTNQSPTYLVGLFDNETNELKACLGFYVTEDTRPVVEDLELFKLGNMLGQYQMGDPQPIAHTFLAADTTRQIAELDVHAKQQMVH